MMRTIFSILLVFFILSVGLSPSLAANDIAVVSVRQYLIKGKSNIHLYLYGLDGTLKKIVTKEPGIDDVNPVFSYDGKTILFTREATDAGRRAKAGKFVMDLESGEIHPYDEATSDDPYIAWSMTDHFEGAFAEGSEGWMNIDSSAYYSPDGRFHITRENNPAPGGEGHVYFLSENQGSPVPIEKLPGFMLPEEIDGYESFLISNDSPYIKGGDFYGVFMRHHLGSTDGEQIWGLDLNTKKWIKVSQNGALIYHPPTAAGVFIDTDELYQPLGNTDKTVNCNYLEWWDAHFKPTRYSPPLCEFYSAAIFHKAGNTLIITGKPGGP